MSLTLVLLSLVPLWFVWKLINAYFSTSPLDILDGPPSVSFIAGNLGQILHRRQGWGFLQSLGERYGRACYIHGLFGTKYLYLSDPLALQAVFSKGRYTFDHPDWMFVRNEFLFGPGLFSLKDDRHRMQRKLLNPAFSPNNLRQITPTFYSVTHRLCEALTAEVGDQRKKVDILDWSSRATLEVMGRAAMGTAFDPLTERVQSPIADALKILVPTLISADPWMSPFFVVPGVIATLGRSWTRLLMSLSPISSVREMVWVSQTLEGTARNLLATKASKCGEAHALPEEEAGSPTPPKDIMSLILEQTADPTAQERLNHEELVAQVGTLLFAGADTSASALACTLQLLASHQDVQTRLREEVITMHSTHGRELTYDQLEELPYLDAVCRETLRLHPPASFSLRRAREDVVLPLSTPVRGPKGARVDAIVCPKGTQVLISILACNRDPTIWGEDALEWKPERWMSPLPDTVIKAGIPGVYSNLMTFLAGGRSCIGFNFSQLEMKVVLSLLLKSFVFYPTGETIYWNLAPIFFPSTDSAGEHGELPMLIERYQPHTARGL